VKHWQKIIDKIQEEMGANSANSWQDSDFALVKLFSAKLTEKLKNMVAQNHILANLLDDKNYLAYRNKAQDEIKKLIQTDIDKKGAGSKYVLDNRTLIPYLIEGNIPSQKRTKNAFCLFAFDMPLDEFMASFENEVQNTNTHLKIKQFYNTHWWLYFFDYDDHNRVGRLGRAVLTISDKHHAEIQNVSSETATHYRGRVEVDNTNQHLFFDFTSSETNEKHLRISVFVGNGKCYPLATGVYMNINARNSMPTGTVIMEQVTDTTIIETMKPILVDFDKAEEQGIHKNIVTFFIEREKNYLKAPHGILTINDLGKWLVDKQHITKS
jgi:hypothetical protein